jgi:hypothetical protein
MSCSPGRCSKHRLVSSSCLYMHSTWLATPHNMLLLTLLLLRLLLLDRRVFHGEDASSALTCATVEQTFSADGHDGKEISCNSVHLPVGVEPRCSGSWAGSPGLPCYICWCWHTYTQPTV